MEKNLNLFVNLTNTLLKSKLMNLVIVTICVHQWIRYMPISV